MLFNNKKGQGTLEYVLLMAILISVFTMVINSAPIKNIFGKEGKFVKAIQGEFEFQYRHGLYGRDLLGEGTNQVDYNTANHTSYKIGSGSRFFGPKTSYP